MTYNIHELQDQLLSRVATSKTFKRVMDVTNMDSCPSDVALLRFDVERNMDHHLEMARWLAGHSLPCSMYFHTRRCTYSIDRMHSIAELGHEIGYHHECLDRCGGDFEKARDLFRMEVELFRRDGFKLHSVCAHGEAGLRRHGYRANHDLFIRYPDLLEECGIGTEVYHWINGKDLLYASDTFRGYSRFFETFDKVGQDSRPIMILTHLHRWHSSRLPILQEASLDLIQQLRNRLKGSRSYDLGY